MNIPEFLIRSRRLVLPEGVGPGFVHVRGEVIAAIGGSETPLPAAPIVDADYGVVMPGLVDTHVHINDPGRADWEGFETATCAAAAGGITTLIDMPLNSVPPTTTVDGLRAKIDAATGRCWVDVGFWGGVVPGNVNDLGPLYEAGVFGFKCFLTPSGVEEFQHVTEADLREAMPRLAALDALLLAHAELPGYLQSAVGSRQLAAGRSFVARSVSSADSCRYSTYLASRPKRAENEAIALLIRLCREFRVRIHIVHLSSAEAVEALAHARAEGLPITVETCPHYVFFVAEEIPDGATQFKCAPPIRDRSNREDLWGALVHGPIELVVSDHSPSPPRLKCLEAGDFMRAWGGIASLQYGLPAVWTVASARGRSVPDIARWMSEAPARLAGLTGRKGRIAVGYDADLVVWNPEATFRIDSTASRHRHKLTPYDGREMRGVVEMTFVRGQRVFDRGIFGSRPTGRVLLRDPRRVRF